MLSTSCDCHKRKAQYMVFTRLTNVGRGLIFVRRETTDEQSADLPASREFVIAFRVTSATNSNQSRRSLPGAGCDRHRWRVHEGTRCLSSRKCRPTLGREQWTDRA